ncbi:hypothetical protein [Kribbella catacumbae]|uniref:hypothetical protein n=1 Tax=Kribbella catacumbae TaxID=460086 RepID=UPI00037DA6DE|nr:hypothetical protein [Kribbella catacumbae]
MSSEDQQRKSLHSALLRHLDQDVNFTAGFVASFVVRVVPVETLAELVAGLDGARPVRWTDTGSGPGVEDRG